MQHAKASPLNRDPLIPNNLELYNFGVESTFLYCRRLHSDRNFQYRHFVRIRRRHLATVFRLYKELDVLRGKWPPSLKHTYRAKALPQFDGDDRNHAVPNTEAMSRNTGSNRCQFWAALLSCRRLVFLNLIAPLIGLGFFYCIIEGVMDAVEKFNIPNALAGSIITRPRSLRPKLFVDFFPRTPASHPLSSDPTRPAPPQDQTPPE